jgi:hypothetical protein
MKLVAAGSIWRRAWNRISLDSGSHMDPGVGSIAMVGTAVFGIPPECIGQHLLAYRLATALDLDAVEHRLQFLGSVDREHLAHVVVSAFRCSNRTSRPAWDGRSSRCRWRRSEAKCHSLAQEQTETVRAPGMDRRPAYL